MQDTIKRQAPLLALRDTVLFPNIIAPLFVGREKSIKALNAAEIINGEEYVLLTAQKNPEVDDPKPTDLFKIGVLAKIIQLVKLPNNNIKILVEAQYRVKLELISSKNGFFSANYEIIPDEEIRDLDKLALATAQVITLFGEYVKNNKKINPDAVNALLNQKNPSHITYIIASHLTNKISNKQELLEINNIEKRIEHLNATLDSEISILEAEQSVQARVKKQMEKTQRDYYLNEQMKAIQKELGDDDKSEISEFEKKIEKLKLSKEAKEKAEAELKKFKTMNPMAAEASVIRNYLDTLLSLPWGIKDKVKVDIKKAAEILDRDHYGLEKVKERIVEYLAVLQRSEKLKGPILCLFGPPGVGKTSLAKSIAEAVGRKYVKFALGGITDEAEIRGHRRTYLGSMPGKIINQIKKVKTSNPLMLLDEIDKVDRNYRGDPTSALLEVLDPEQNIHFADHYLEVEYDLSDVMFIATANSLHMPRPLRDRMEIIHISGYLEEEKLQIAKRHLIPKILKDHGLKENEFIITDEALLELIRYYTRESGVRSLERQISALARKVLKKILEDKNTKSLTVKPDDLESYLGPRKHRYGEAETEDMIGVTTGLAYTEVGGDLLSIEAVTVPGKGDIKATGQLGDVMKESMQAAFSFFKSTASDYGLSYDTYKDLDIHVHVPEGAIPKDGPSAGIAIFTTLVSILSGIPVKRNVAMTGEITLRGRVLAIGGLKEKLLAASRGGITTVIIPKDNVKDLQEIPEGITSKLEIIPVSYAEEVLEIALAKKKEGETVH
jgi:ATP-dependent Lon protease